MSRIEIARVTTVVLGLLVSALIAYVLVLRREQRRRTFWSTRTRANRPHWSIALATRIERFTHGLAWRRQHRSKRRHKRDL